MVYTYSESPSPQERKMTEVKKVAKKKKPSFKRHESFKHKKLKDSWRKPRGRHSKVRVRMRGKRKMPSIGYRNPLEIRGLTRSGYRDVRVSNISDIEKLDPKKERAVIAHGVGRKKRLEILKKAEELRIKVANRPFKLK